MVNKTTRNQLPYPDVSSIGWGIDFNNFLNSADTLIASVGANNTFTSANTFMPNSAVDAVTINQPYNYNALKIINSVNPTFPFVVNYEGFLGIGTATPGSVVDIYQNGTTNILLQIRSTTTTATIAMLDSSSNYVKFTSNSGSLNVYVGGANRLTIAQSTGYIGAGVATANAQLEVKNTFRISNNSSGYVNFTIPNTSATVSYVLPNADGTNNFVLTTDGFGNLSWTTKTGGSGGTITSLNGSSSASQTILGLSGGSISVADSGTGSYLHTISLSSTGTAAVAGYVPFWSGANGLNANANLFWDNTHSRLGIGTITPATSLDMGTGVITTSGGTSTNWNTAYGWGNHASVGYLNSNGSVPLSGSGWQVDSNNVMYIERTTAPGPGSVGFGIDPAQSIAPLIVSRDFASTAVNVTNRSAVAINNAHSSAAASQVSFHFSPATVPIGAALGVGAAIGAMATNVATFSTGATANLSFGIRLNTTDGDLHEVMNLSNTGAKINLVSTAGPALKIVGGINSSGVNSLSIFDGWATPLFIVGGATSSSNVGVSISDPKSPFHVQDLSSGSGTGVVKISTYNYDELNNGTVLRMGFVSGGSSLESRTYSSGSYTRTNLVLNSSGGNVGVGTITPAAVFSVVDVYSTGNTPNVLISTSDAKATDKGGRIGLGGVYDNAGDIIAFGAIRAGKTDAVSGHTTGYLSFQTSNGSLTDVMRIDSAGNVGIGTNTPASALDMGASGVITTSGGTSTNWNTAYGSLPLSFYGGGGGGAITTTISNTASTNVSYIVRCHSYDSSGKSFCQIFNLITQGTGFGIGVASYNSSQLSSISSTGVAGISYTFACNSSGNFVVTAVGGAIGNTTIQFSA